MTRDDLARLAHSPTRPSLCFVRGARPTADGTLEHLGTRGQTTHRQIGRAKATVHPSRTQKRELEKPKYYHLAINTDRISPEVAAQIIILAVRQKETGL
jgi:hypothetical protein